MSVVYKFNDPDIGAPGGSGNQIGQANVLNSSATAPWSGQASGQGPQVVDTVFGGGGALQTVSGVTPQLEGRGGPRLGEIRVGQDTGYIAGTANETTAAVGPFGEAEFMYVQFTGNVNAGDFVVIDRYQKTCVQASTATVLGPVGISMAAQAANQYGWVMIRGIHDSANVANASNINARCYLTATAGRINTTQANTDGLEGVLVKLAPAGNVAVAELYWPMANGNN